MTKKKLTSTIKSTCTYMNIDMNICDIYELYNIDKSVDFEKINYALSEMCFKKNRSPIAFLQELQANFDIDRYIKYIEYRKSNKFDSVSIKFFELKYGKKIGTKKFNERAKEKTPSLSLWVEKYGVVNGTERWNNFCERNKGNHTLERYIELYGNTDGIKKYNEGRYKLKNKNTLKYHIEIFGEIEGTKRYKDKNDKNSESSKLNSIWKRNTPSYNVYRVKQEKLGNWVALEDLSDYQIYSKLVWFFTNNSPLKTLNNFEKRGHQRDKGTYAVDHKISVKAGFDNFILPSIIGNIDNLQILTHSENCSKKAKCYSKIN